MLTVNREVPEHQGQTLAYMLDVEPVARTMEQLIEAMRLVKEGKDYDDLPPAIRDNKCFDGGHTGTEGKYLADLLQGETLHLRVCRGYIAMEQGDEQEVIGRQLDQSQQFFVALLSEAEGGGASSNGLEFTINRDGSLREGTSSASCLTTGG